MRFIFFIQLFKYDSEISLSAVNLNFYDEFNKIGPFGNSNSTPLFLIKNVYVIKSNLITDNHISSIIKTSFGRSLKSICFIVMFHSYLINSKDVWNFQDSSIKVLNIFEKSIKKKFLIFKQDTSFVIKNCQVNFFNLCLLNKLKCIFKREKGFFKNSGKQGIVKNNFSQETLIHDFSEYFSLNSKHSLKKFIKNDFY